MSEQFTFQAETQQLLDILIHSLYTEKEIFLRELISNASDALNRLQFEMLTNDNIKDSNVDLEIHLTVDEENNTLTITDTGVGMTREEVIENLGTIAQSGAKAFMEAVKDKPDNGSMSDIIGQFGVGFYSVFMVADQVDVITRSYQPDAEAVKWSAQGGTSYTLEPADKDIRGTEIVIHLKEDEKDFTRAYTLKEIIRRYSDYVAFAIYVGDDEEATNKQQALWRRDPSEVEQDEYDNFYKMLTMDFGGALHHIHMRADVPMQFYTMLFIPSTSQQNMFSPRKEPGLKLFARKVLIEEYNKGLLPEYLQFVHGVVDSEDLPLSVNRESIQATRVMASLKKTVTRKVLSELKRMTKRDREKYLKIFEEFGSHIKQGLVMQPDDKTDLEPLLFFQTTHDDDQTQYYSLDEYVERMDDNQDDIYYIVADDYASGHRSPHLDAFRQRDIEVLYFTHPVDAMLPMGLTDYKGHKFVSVDSSEIDLSDVGEAKESEDAKEALEETSFVSLKDRVKAILGNRVSDVLESKTLVGSPARLVSDDESTNRYMYRINRMLDKDYELPVKTLELNTRHPLAHNLSNLLANNGDEKLINAVVEQIFETALLQDGIHPDPSSMAERLTLLMQAATGSSVADLDFAAAATVIVEPEIVEPSDNMDMSGLEDMLGNMGASGLGDIEDVDFTEVTEVEEDDE
jgi:molecular chaperone HtpG